MSSTSSAADQTVSDFIARGATGPLPRHYGDALVAAARKDPRIVCLCADLPGPTETDLFQSELPDRYFEAGIAEANMMGMGAGFARMGQIPFVHSFCVFVTRRAYDQVANQVAYPKLPVKIVGFLPGLTTMLGVSHQAIDDVALMRALPNMTVIEPSGPEQLAGAVTAALETPGPVYLRMLRGDAASAGIAHKKLSRTGEVLRRGPHGTIFASGLSVAAAIEAAETLGKDGREVTVVNIATLKPLDTALIIELAKATGTVVTAENHSIIGGLGSAVAETLMEAGVSAGFARVGIQDTFAEGGTTPYLHAKYGLGAKDIVAAYGRAAAQRNAIEKGRA